MQVAWRGRWPDGLGSVAATTKQNGQSTHEFFYDPYGLVIDENGKPLRLDKAYSWEAPMANHGLMHMVISNAYAGDPYKIDTLFMYMANMSWNSSMNTSGVIDMLTDRDENGDYVIPRIIYSDAYSSEMVAYADLILPDTTYLERHDCISLLDRPICEADAAATSVAHEGRCAWICSSKRRPDDAVSASGFSTSSPFSGRARASNVISR